ncbi:MAG: S66 peptidase family protein [Myxococcota bacterium]
MERIRYPKGLRSGDTIAVVAPSSGVVEPEIRLRFERVLAQLRGRGYTVAVGDCVYREQSGASAPAAERAEELMRFWLDPTVRALLPPWGGEMLIEVLPRLDLATMATVPPPWVMGFSDISTLTFPLTALLGVATLHGTAGVDLLEEQTDPLTSLARQAFGWAAGDAPVQQSSTVHQANYPDLEANPTLPFDLSEKTRWRLLSGNNHAVVRGRLLGGCLDTLMHLTGTPFGDLRAFQRFAREDGVLFYLENCELNPHAVGRGLWGMRMAGWLEGVNAVVLGRNCGPDASDETHRTFEEAVEIALGDLGVPVILEADIGHSPPQLTLVNGAMAEIVLADGQASVTQRLM